MLATPWTLVTAVALESVALAPDTGAEKFTVIPLSGLPPASFTVACSAVKNGMEIVAVCVAPPVAVTLAGGPAVFVRLKFAVSAPTLAVTAYDPGAVLAVAMTLAWPWALVTAAPPESVALAPEAGTEKFTVTPLNRLPPASFTVTCSGAANAVAICTVCGVAL